MRWLSWEPLMEISPVGLLAAGVVLGAGSPAIKSGLRGLAVGATKGILSISNQLKETGEKINEDWQDMVAEAKASLEPMRQGNAEVIPLARDTEHQILESINAIKKEFTNFMDETRQELNQLKVALKNTPVEQKS